MTYNNRGVIVMPRSRSALATTKLTFRKNSVRSSQVPTAETQPTAPTSPASELTPHQNLLAMGIFLQALVAMTGSLYYSTFGDPVLNFQQGNLFPVGQGLEPCILCWFARILMYPIVILSYVGMAKKDRGFVDYILPLSVLGIALDTYHYSIQKFPIQNIFGCSSAHPCNAMEVNYLGYITIPLLALTAFVVITGLAVMIKRASRSN